jgi:hypothetical protein
LGQLTDRTIDIIIDSMREDRCIQFLSLEDLMWSQVKVFDFCIEDLEKDE